MVIISEGVEFLGEMRKLYKIINRIRKKGPLGRLGIGGKIILRCILRKKGVCAK
jgi:hypothetical protein